MKLCPYCAEEIQDAAIVCKHCGRELNPEAVAAQAESKDHEFVPDEELGTSLDEEQLWITPAKTKLKNSNWGCIISVLFVIAILLGWMITNTSGISSSRSATPLPRVTIWCPDCADAGMEVNLWSKAGGAAAGATVLSSVPHDTIVSEVRARSVDGVSYIRVDYRGNRGWLTKSLIRR